jgi:hypothetical protein
MSVKKGDKRGKYEPRSRPCGSTWDEKWTSADLKHCADLVADSPLASEVAKAAAARRATELARQCRELDGRVRTTDEEKALVASSSQYRRWLEVLQVAQRTLDEEEEI